MNETLILKNLKAHARRAKNGAYPYLTGLSLTTIQRLLDGKSPNYQVIAGRGGWALKYNDPTPNREDR